ncbi:MAG: hypothetical protein ABJB47_24315, partial [Actinomycetota bacterium]
MTTGTSARVSAAVGLAWAGRAMLVLVRADFLTGRAGLLAGVAVLLAESELLAAGPGPAWPVGVSGSPSAGVTAGLGCRVRAVLVREVLVREVLVR